MVFLPDAALGSPAAILKRIASIKPHWRWKASKFQWPSIIGEPVA